MIKELDCRNLACPAPVLQAKALIEQDHPESIRVTVDNEAAGINVTRFLQSQGYAVETTRQGELIHVTGHISASGQGGGQEPATCQVAGQKIMVLVTSDRIGHGDDRLGEKLMANFLKTLGEMGSELWRLVFVNNGVKLTAAGSKVLPQLETLARDGTRILVCGTCLEHFKLLEQEKVGETTNMLDIVTAMQLAGKVITL